ncbi:lethal(2) giant larvae protein [Sarotherodon galilaeus]
MHTLTKTKKFLLNWKTVSFYTVCLLSCLPSLAHLEPTYQALLDSSFQLPVTSPFSNGQSLLPASLHCTLYPPGFLSPALPLLQATSTCKRPQFSPALSLHPVVPVI